MPYSSQINENVGLVATIEPVSAAGSYLTDAIDLGIARRLIAYIPVGTIGASATVDFAFEWATTSGGTYTVLTTGYAITQDTTGSKCHIVEFAVEQLKAANPTARFVKGKLTIGTAATPCAVVVLGGSERYQPVANQAAAIGQVITSKAG